MCLLFVCFSVSISIDGSNSSTIGVLCLGIPESPFCPRNTTDSRNGTRPAEGTPVTPEGYEGVVAITGLLPGSFYIITAHDGFSTESTDGCTRKVLHMPYFKF